MKQGPRLAVIVAAACAACCRAPAVLQLCSCSCVGSACLPVLVSTRCAAPPACCLANYWCCSILLLLLLLLYCVQPRSPAMYVWHQAPTACPEWCTSRVRAALLTCTARCHTVGERMLVRLLITLPVLHAVARFERERLVTCGLPVTIVDGMSHPN
jgi:hypothetical protein